MKKLLSVILAITMLLSFAPLCFAASTGKYIVTRDVTGVYASPSIAAEKIAEITKNTYIEITEIRNDTFGKAYIPKDGVTGWIQLGALELVTPPKADTSVTGIKIQTLPAKLTYIDNWEELDLTGLTVVSTDINGTQKYITGYSVYAPEMTVPGEKTVRVTYSPDNVNTYSDEFTVTVERQPVKSIGIIKAPKTDYMENQTADFSDLIVMVSFEDSSKDKAYTFEQISRNPDFTLSGCHGETHGSVLSKGEHTMRVTYKYSDIYCEFTLNVTPRNLISLTVKQQPDNLTVYSNTKVPALDGLILEATYDNGETEEVYHYNCEAVCDPSQFIIGPGNKVDVYFSGMYVTLEFRYSIAVPEKIVIIYPQNFTLNFLKGEEIDLSAIRVRLVYTDDTFRYVEDFTMGTPDYTVTGTQHIPVTYNEFSEVFTINISPYFSKGDVDGDGVIRAYDARQTLRAAVGLVNLSGMTFFAGDADRNDKITANDARLILRASVGLENLYITI